MTRTAFYYCKSIAAFCKVIVYPTVLRIFRIGKIRKYYSPKGADKLIHQPAGFFEIIVLRLFSVYGDKLRRNASAEKQAVYYAAQKHLKSGGGRKPASRRNFRFHIGVKAAEYISAFDKPGANAPQKGSGRSRLFRAGFGIAYIHGKLAEAGRAHRYRIRFVRCRKGGHTEGNARSEDAAALVVGMVSPKLRPARNKNFRFIHFCRLPFCLPYYIASE